MAFEPASRISARGLSFFPWNREARVTESASATAFWVLIALGPAGLVAINLLGLIVDQSVIADHLIAIADSAPGSFGDLLMTQVTVIASPSPGSILLDALLVVTSLWTISTAVSMLMNGLRRAYGLPNAHFLLLRALASLAGLVSIIVLGLLSFAIDTRSTAQLVVGLTSAMILSFMLLVSLHKLAVGRAFPARSLWPGAAFSTIALLLIQLLWERAASLSPNTAMAYGAITDLVTSMIAVWLAAFATLLGVFVNRWLLARQRSMRD